MYKTKKYTLWSNFRFVFTPVWKEKRSYIRDMITGIILSVIVPVIGSMLSALVVGLLGESLSAVTVIAAILSAFVGLCTCECSGYVYQAKACLSSHRGAFPAFYEAVYKKNLRDTTRAV